MERAQIFVIAAVVAALGLFGARFWFDRDTSDVGQWVRNVRSHSDSASTERDLANPGEPNTTSEKRPKAPGSDAAAGGEPERSDVAAANGRGLGSRSVLGAGGAGSGRDRQPETMGGTAPPARGATNPNPGEGSGVLESLPSTKPVAAEPNPVRDKPAEPEDGLLLSVANAQDVDRANVSSAVEADEDGLKFTDDSQLVYDDGTVHGDAGTIAFSLQPQWNGRDASDNSLVQVRNEDVWNNRLQIVKNGSYLRFILADDSGQEADISYKIDDWEPGQQHRIAATWGDARTALYVDGRLVGQNTYAGPFRAENSPLLVGSDFEGGDYAGARATIKDFKVYGKVLPDSRLVGRR